MEPVEKWQYELNSNKTDIKTYMDRKAQIVNLWKQGSLSTTLRIAACVALAKLITIDKNYKPDDNDIYVLQTGCAEGDLRESTIRRLLRDRTPDAVAMAKKLYFGNHYVPVSEEDLASWHHSEEQAVTHVTQRGAWNEITLKPGKQYDSVTQLLDKRYMN